MILRMQDVCVPGHQVEVEGLSRRRVASELEIGSNTIERHLQLLDLGRRDASADVAGVADHLHVPPYQFSSAVALPAAATKPAATEA